MTNINRVGQSDLPRLLCLDRFVPIPFNMRRKYYYIKKLYKICFFVRIYTWTVNRFQTYELMRECELVTEPNPNFKQFCKKKR